MNCDTCGESEIGGGLILCSDCADEAEDNLFMMRAVQKVLVDAVYKGYLEGMTDSCDRDEILEMAMKEAGYDPKA